MPASESIERSFSGGEIAPALYARTDHVKYSTGLRTCRNNICMRHGGVTQRPGSQYVATIYSSGNPVRGIPFIFNETGTGQSYVLIFSNRLINIYQNGGQVINSGTGFPVQVNTNYLQADLAYLHFAQCNDVVTITHPNYPPMDLTRVTPINWTLTPCTFLGTMGQVTISSFSGGTHFAGPSLTYAVTAIAANGDETPSPLPYLAVSGGFSLQSSSATPVVINFTPVTGAISYRIYKYAEGILVTGAVLGFIGTALAGATSFSDNGLLPDYTQPPPVTGALYALINLGQYPSNVAYVQQRKIFSNTPNNPIGAWASAAGSFTNFNVMTPTADNDSYTFTLAGDEVNAIQHVLELKFMLGLTSGAELFIQGNGSGVVTPSAINAVAQSYYGANPLRPIKIGEVCIFLQALGNFVRDLVFDFVIDGYRGNDLTIFSAHLFEGHTIVDWAYQKIPDSILWAVRDDGVLLSLTYVREQQILAWTRHDFTNGFVENVVCIPENGNYATYIVVRRIIQGQTVRYLERLSSRIWSDPINASYLDAFLLYDGRNTTTTSLQLTVSGSFDKTNRAYEQLLTLNASAALFTSVMVGDQFFLNDNNGNQIRLTISTFVNSTQVLGYPNRSVPITLQGVSVTNWAHAVKSVTGLSHLIGQTVSIWADRFVVGSPLNLNYQTKYAVFANGNLINTPLGLVSDGQVNLDKPYSVIYVGLPMTADFETLDIDSSFGESIIDQPKAISRVVVYLYNARGFFGGTKNPDLDPDNIVNGVVQDPLFNLFENKDQDSRLTYDQAPLLITDPAYTNVDCNWSNNGRIFIRNIDPIPLSILAVVPAGLTAAKIPYAQKV